MPDPSIAVALVLLVALVESTPAVRIPLGLLLAIALLAADAELLPIALLGAIGVMLARLSLALAARTGRDRRAAGSSRSQAQRESLRAFLARSPAYARTTFVLAALPGVPAAFVFPLLGAMRAPLWPALAGTIVGRIPVLAITAALFAWIGRLATESDHEAAVLLGVLAIFLFVLRTISRIDWQHRAETGRWRLREERDPFIAMTTRVGDGATGGWSGTFPPGAHDPVGDAISDDIVEGELLGEEVDDEDQESGGSDDEPPGALPPSGAAPA